MSEKIDLMGHIENGRAASLENLERVIKARGSMQNPDEHDWATIKNRIDVFIDLLKAKATALPGLKIDQLPETIAFTMQEILEQSAKRHSANPGLQQKERTEYLNIMNCVATALGVATQTNIAFYNKAAEREHG